MEIVRKYLAQYGCLVLVIFMLMTGGKVHADSKAAISSVRIIPRSLPHHPGNVFLAGEAVRIAVPANASGNWRAFDIDARQIASGPGSQGVIELSHLPVGYYRIEWESGQKVALAVLTPLAAPVPDDSPVCIMTWFAGFYILNRLDRIDDAANLAALAGINSIRDATAWTWQTGADGKLTDHGSRKAESFGKVLAAARQNGLRLMLQLQPGTPSKYAVPADWGTRIANKFPADLRDYAGFSRHAVAQAGRDVEWESWNEPDGIGGMHLGSELTAAAKVFTLAARSVNPDVVVGVGGANAGKAALTDAMHQNDYLNAVDAYIYHNHSGPVEAMKKRRMLDPYTGNRPVWVTEYSYGAYPCLPKSTELTSDGERQQAADIPKIFARGLHEGNERLYYFMLLSFGETVNRQWGVLRGDFQPRPAYLALAATGRLLAGAKPVGPLTGLPADAEGWVFHASPDGQDNAVAIIWKNIGQAVDWQPPSSVTAWDLWGRPLSSSRTLRIGAEPVYCVFDRQSLANWKITPPLARPTFARSASRTLCPVVADFRLADRYKNNSGDFFLFTKSDMMLDFDIYNFAGKSLNGSWRVEAPPGYSAVIVEQPGNLIANDRQILRVNLRMSAPWRPDTSMKPQWLRLRGDYGSAGDSVIAIRFVNCPSDHEPSQVIPVSRAMDGAKWKSVAATDTIIKTERDNSWLKFNITTGTAPNLTIGTSWASPLYHFSATELPGVDVWGVTLRIRRFDAPPGTILALNLIKKNGAAWTCPLPVELAKIASIEGTRLILPFSWFAHIEYRKPDPEGNLSSGDICAVEIVSISLPDSTVKFEVSDFAWVRGEFK